MPTHETRSLVRIRKDFKQKYGLPMRVELHAAELINPRGNRTYQRIPGGRRRRIELYREFLARAFLAMPDARVINVYCDKTKKAPAFSIDEQCWDRLLTRFHTHLRADKKGSLGMVFADETNENNLRRLLRKMRVFNYVPSHFGGSYQYKLDLTVEDVVMRNSSNSYFIQVADMVAHALYRKASRKGSLRRYKAEELFDEVDRNLLKQASRRCQWSQGVVWT